MDVREFKPGFKRTAGGAYKEEPSQELRPSSSPAAGDLGGGGLPCPPTTGAGCWWACSGSPGRQVSGGRSRTTAIQPPS
jgi:hypothetical protein